MKRYCRARSPGTDMVRPGRGARVRLLMSPRIILIADHFLYQLGSMPPFLSRISEACPRVIPVRSMPRFLAASHCLSVGARFQALFRDPIRAPSAEGPGPRRCLGGGGGVPVAQA